LILVESPVNGTKIYLCALRAVDGTTQHSHISTACYSFANYQYNQILPHFDLLASN
jgi:hypothetical protein